MRGKTEGGFSMWTNERKLPAEKIWEAPFWGDVRKLGREKEGTY